MSRPSLMLPTRDSPQYNAKITKEVAIRTYHHPTPPVIALFSVLKAPSAVVE